MMTDSNTDRLQVAGHPETSAEVLARLAQELTGRHRGGGPAAEQALIKIAQHPNTPPATLTTLAHHRYQEIRTPVARNPNTPPATLEGLAQDKSIKVREALLANPELSGVTLETLAVWSHEIELLEQVASHPATPPETLVQMSRDYPSATRLRRNLFANPNYPEEELQRMVGEATRIAGKADTATEVELSRLYGYFKEVACGPPGIKAAYRVPIFYAALATMPHLTEDSEWSETYTGLSEMAWKMAMHLAPTHEGRPVDLQDTVMAIIAGAEATPQLLADSVKRSSMRSASQADVARPS